MDPRDEAAVLDVLKATRLVRDFIGALDDSAFHADYKTQSAVIHQLLILGEAVKRLTPEFRRKHSTIPWRRIAGMRDVLIHQYDDIDLEAVWKTATVDLPELIAYLEPLAPPRQGQE